MKGAAAFAALVANAATFFIPVFANCFLNGAIVYTGLTCEFLIELVHSAWSNYELDSHGIDRHQVSLLAA